MLRNLSFQPCIIVAERGSAVFNAWKKQGIQSHEGIPELNDLAKRFSKGRLLVMDDLMDGGGSEKRILDLFTKHCHHRNITILYLCQDMFLVGKCAKSISRNAHYIVAFKNPRDSLGI